MRWCLSILVSGVLLGSCAPGRTSYRVVIPPSAEALSFLGDTLWTLPIDPREGPGRVARLQPARQRAADRPNHVESQILLARRTAEIGRFRDAIALYTQAIAASPVDRRLYRRRGELLLRIRELRLAMQDLQYASRASLAATGIAPEFNEFEGPGGLVETTLLHSSLHLLGMAFYLDGRFLEARNVWLESLKRAATSDDMVQSALWLFYATHQARLTVEANALLAALPDTIDINRSFAEWDLLRAHRGILAMEQLPVNLHGPLRTGDDALYGYGVGLTLLILDRWEEAALVFRKVLATRDWSALAYLAAEADLARIQRTHPRTP